MLKQIKRFYHLSFFLALPLVIAACGSSSSSGGGGGSDANQDGDISTATVSRTALVSGSYTPGVSLGVDTDGSLKFTVSAADTNGDGTVGTPTIDSVTVSSGDTASTLVKSATRRLTDSSVTCGSRDVGTGSTDDKFDIAVSLDTTASMGSAAGIIASKIADFATALGDAGVDAKFAGITVGDAFDTKGGDDIANIPFDDDVSVGSLGEVPSFDTCERPSTGAALIGAADMATFFDEVGTDVESGCNGNGGTENYLGPIQYGNDQLAWRDGAARVMITIGDNCAWTDTTAEDGDGITADWLPPDPDALIADLTANGTVVHVVGGAGLSCTDLDYYEMADLATATGGTWTDIGSCGSEDTCTVDLTALPISSSITSGTVEDCATTSSLLGADGTFTFRLTITIEDSTAVVDVVVVLVLI